MQVIIFVVIIIIIINLNRCVAQGHATWKVQDSLLSSWVMRTC